jgi:hypothetical protein
MEGAVGAERDDLRILGDGRAPPRHSVMHTTSISSILVKGIPLYVAATTR